MVGLRFCKLNFAPLKHFAFLLLLLVQSLNSEVGVKNILLKTLHRLLFAVDLFQKEFIALVLVVDPVFKALDVQQPQIHFLVLVLFLSHQLFFRLLAQILQLILLGFDGLFDFLLDLSYFFLELFFFWLDL